MHYQALDLPSRDAKLVICDANCVFTLPADSQPTNDAMAFSVASSVCVAFQNRTRSSPGSVWVA